MSFSHLFRTSVVPVFLEQLCNWHLLRRHILSAEISLAAENSNINFLRIFESSGFASIQWERLRNPKCLSRFFMSGSCIMPQIGNRSNKLKKVCLDKCISFILVFWLLEGLLQIATLMPAALSTSIEVSLQPTTVTRKQHATSYFLTTLHFYIGIQYVHCTAHINHHSFHYLFFITSNFFSSILSTFKLYAIWTGKWSQLRSHRDAETSYPHAYLYRQSERRLRFTSFFLRW